MDPYSSQTLLEDNFADDLSTDAVNISAEISIDDFDQGTSVGFEVVHEMSSKIEQEIGLSEEETEIRKTAQALFALEESLLDQHISNIKVRNWSCVCSFIVGLFFSNQVIDFK